MKRLLTLVSALALLVAVSANAQSGGIYTTTLNAGTNNVAAGATNSYAITQACSEFDHVGFTLTTKSSTHSTNNTWATVRIAKAVDVGVYESTPSLVYLFQLNDTNSHTYVTVIDTEGIAGLKITSIENTNDVALTNISAKFRLKAPKTGTYSVAK